ncbi:hypothetical protein [Microbulbifer sp. TRSA005]|uniref:hypothetical protein n=1 Tax=unclassified Microbulbifer TaxID=2619833 RepID=UPI00403A66E4
MSYFVMTEGIYKIDEIFFGATKDELVEKARDMIDQWPEYIEMETDEIIEMAEAGNAEFDLVEMSGPMPSQDISKAELISLYESQHS